MSNRAERRHHERRIQRKRVEIYTSHGIKLGDVAKGKLKNCSGGCSCFLCKPWKAGHEDELRPSERRRVQKEVEADSAV